MSNFDPDGPAAKDAGIYGLPHSEEEARVVLIPVPFEATVSYGGGAAQGPEAIMAASHQVDLYDIETGKPYVMGIHMCPPNAEVLALNASAKVDARWVIDAGAQVADDPELLAARDRVNKASLRVNAITHDTTRRLLDAGKIVGVVGGDHSAPFGSIAAHAERFGEMGILHLDAHADLRTAYEGFTWSHASIMERVTSLLPGVSSLVQIGIRDFGKAELDLIRASKGRIHTVFDAEVARSRLNGRLISLFDEAVSKLPAQVYMSFDIDGMDPRFCPGTGTPVPGGLDFNEVSILMEAVVRAKKRIVGFDLCEVAPRAGDEWDGNVGARLLYKMIGWTVRSQAVHD